MPEGTEVQQVATPATETTTTPATPATAAVATPAVERKVLESKVSEGLAKLFGEDSAVVAAAAAKEVPPADDATAEGDEATTDATESVEDSGMDAEEAAATAAAASAAAATTNNAPTLPAAYVRSLKSDGWTDDEIAEQSKVAGFQVIAGKIHDRRNAETAKWADAGRQFRQQQQATQQQQTHATQQPAASTGLKPIDMEKLKEKYGDDAILDEIGKVNGVIAQLNLILPQVQDVQRKSQANELETVARQIDGFFGGKELEPFKHVYGDAKTIATDATAQTARNKVLETTDALIAGARLQGRSLTLGEALTMAHDSLSGGYKIQAVRTQIKQTLQTRNKGITLKPGGKANNPTGINGKDGRTAFEKRVATGLAAVFK